MLLYKRKKGEFNMSDHHKYLRVALHWARQLGVATFDKNESVVLAKVEDKGKEYQIFFHMRDEVLVFSIAIETKSEKPDELAFYRIIGSANSAWPLGAFIYSPELGMVVHRDSLEPEEDHILEEYEIRLLFDRGVEAIHYLTQSLSDCFPKGTPNSLEFMVPQGRA